MGEVIYMNKKCQTSEIKKYLETHKRGISSIEAIDKFGATRLSSIIYTLRTKYKMPIVTETSVVKTRYGRSTTVATYKLEQ